MAVSANEPDAMNKNNKSTGAAVRSWRQHYRRMRLKSIKWKRKWSWLALLLAGCVESDADFSAMNEPSAAAPDSIAATATAGGDSAKIDTLGPALNARIDWGKNPFLRPGATDTKSRSPQPSITWAREETALPAAMPSPRWTLKGILARDRRRIAIINQKILAPGDLIDGYRLVAIHRDSVTLSQDDDTIVLRLK
jgi:hypothetical protein